MTSNAPWHWSGESIQDLARGDDIRNLLNQMSASLGWPAARQVSSPRGPLMPWLQPGGTLAATSFYDTKHLKHTLERLVDFDRLNAGMTRFSAGAVNVRTGNFVYFDTEHPHDPARACHGERSAAAGFPAVEIDGEQYWDGGLMSNTPLAMGHRVRPRTRSRTGHARVSGRPLELAGHSFRAILPTSSPASKEIQFSSRTRASTDHFKRVQRIQTRH